MFFFTRQPTAYIRLVVITEMVKEFTRQETLMVHPYQIKRWLDPFDTDIIG